VSSGWKTGTQHAQALYSRGRGWRDVGPSSRLTQPRVPLRAVMCGWDG